MQAFELRQMDRGDESFVFATWLKSHRQSRFASVIPADAYFRGHHLVIERILARPSVRATVAHPVGERDTILGYSVSEGSTIHWVYVKLPFRGLGIARALLGDIDVPHATISHLTKDAEKALLRWPCIIHNPYAW
jgi:GNAT superfamily N-acetyltransferase